MGIITPMLSYILVSMIVVTMVFLALTRLAVERLENNHYGQRADFFRCYPVNPGDIVFLGDSITDGGCWEELFPGVPLKNRGINADTTMGVLNRIDDILCCQPRAIFLLIGTNDLSLHIFRSNTDILRTYTQILERCRVLSPATRVFVQSILPRHQRFSRRVRFLNIRLKELATAFNDEFIDLYPSFVNSAGALKTELTNDNLHLMAEGYALWVKILQPFIDDLKKV